MRFPRIKKSTSCRKQVFIALFLLSSAFSGSFSQQISHPDRQSQSQQRYEQATQAYERFVSEQMAFDQTPGLSVGFIKDDFAWAQGFGYADLENRIPATPESSYRMASITKTFTAFAVLQLVEKGEMDLDTEIQAYVPYFPKKKWPLTVRQLLGHLGGIPHYVDKDKELYIKTHKNTKEAIAIFQDYDLVAQPGTKYHYSSYGYNLLGAAIEEASGQPYGEYLRQHIFDPLGMSDSRMDDVNAEIPNRVKGYRLINGRIAPSEFVDMSSRFAAGGTRSTIADLLKYARGIIQKKLVASQTWRQMLVPMASADGILTGKGMGWNVQPRRGHFLLFHGGSQAETKTYLLIFPLEHFAVAIASNLETFDRELYAYKLAELVLEEDLDTPVYGTDEREEAFYEACEQVFSYGLSHYLWHIGTLARNEKDLEKAFHFFNENTDPATLRRDFQATLEDLAAGIHPIKSQVFTKVGSFMAAQLEKAKRRENLHEYHKKGPVAFFQDYDMLTKTLPSQKKSLRFRREFRQMLARWERDATKSEASGIGLIPIPFDADLAKLQNSLRDAFSASSLYPDVHKDLMRVAQYHLKKENPQQALSLLRLAHEWYPRRIRPMTSLASLYLWIGNAPYAKQYFRMAFEKDPAHPDLSIDRFQALARDLISADKKNSLVDLAAIATDLYPRSPGIFKGLGDMFENLGMKDAALLYYKKALKVNRKLEDVRKKIKALEKERKK